MVKIAPVVLQLEQVFSKSENVYIYDTIPYFSRNHVEKNSFWGCLIES